MPNQLIVITLLCNDRPGIVQQIADTINGEGGSWLESRMSQLAGKFAGILKVSIANDKVDDLRHALKELSGAGIELLIDSAEDNEQIATGKKMAFELIGADRIGIVKEIAKAFNEKDISIDELETQCSSMPWSGEPLFEIKGVLITPNDINKNELLERLDQIEDNLGVDISISEQL